LNPWYGILSLNWDKGWHRISLGVKRDRLARACAWTFGFCWNPTVNPIDESLALNGVNFDQGPFVSHHQSQRVRISLSYLILTLVNWWINGYPSYLNHNYSYFNFFVILGVVYVDIEIAQIDEWESTYTASIGQFELIRYRHEPSETASCIVTNNGPTVGSLCTYQITSIYWVHCSAGIRRPTSALNFT